MRILRRNRLQILHKRAVYSVKLGFFSYMTLILKLLFAGCRMRLWRENRFQTSSENDRVFGKKKEVFPLRGMNFTLWIFSKRISRQNRFHISVKNDRVFGKTGFF